MSANATAEQDFDQLIATLQKRLLKLELQTSNPEVMGVGGGTGGGSAEFDELWLPDEDGSGYVNLWVPPPVPPAPVLTTGAFYDRSYIDVDWDPVLNAGGGYNIRLMRKLGPDTYDTPEFFHTYSSSIRLEPVDPLVTYGVTISSVSSLGRESAQTAVQEIAVGADSTLAPAPTGVVVSRGATTVLVKYTPLTYAEAEDVANGKGMYEVQIDTVNTFDSVNFRQQRGTDQIIAFNDVLVEASWYARVRAIDSSGNSGIWSAVAGPTQAGGVIDSMIVAGLDAAKITTGFLSASRIQTNTLTADKLATGTISAAELTIAGTGKILVGGGSPFTGIYISSAGMWLFKAGAVSLSLDAVTGDAAFAGTITASSIVSSAFNWGVGVLDANGMRIWASANSGTTTGAMSLAKSISFIKGVSAFETCWSIWAPNYGNLRIDRVNRNAAGTGTLSDITLGCRRAVLVNDNVAGTSVCTMTWSSTISDSNTNISGNFSATFKSFVIDHPLDPENKLLIHSTLEGPEHGVYYRGRGKLTNGEAVIELPSYFDALIDDDSEPPTVQITPIHGGPAIVLEASLVEDGKFTVYGADSKEFFWQVTAARIPPRPFEAEIEKDVLAGAAEWIRALDDELDGVEGPSVPLVTVGAVPIN